VLRASSTACPPRNGENEHFVLSGGKSNKKPENSDSLSSGNKHMWTQVSGQSNRRAKKIGFITIIL
jgi:hypothetical protein